MVLRDDSTMYVRTMSDEEIQEMADRHNRFELQLEEVLPALRDRVRAGLPVPVQEMNWVLFWHGSGGYPAGSFSQALIKAIALADLTNQARIGLGFPDLVSLMQVTLYLEYGKRELQDLVNETEGSVLPCGCSRWYLQRRKMHRLGCRVGGSHEVEEEDGGDDGRA